jgi:crotonobetainyl-CoA:carnitine CoA-transferase CaiB-like acyl-CoA transferase
MLVRDSADEFEAKGMWTNERESNLLDGVMQPAPAPRFSRTGPKIQGPPPVAGEHTDAILEKWGFNVDEFVEL